MPKISKPTQKQIRFASAYCNEARGVVATAYEMVADIGPLKLKQKVEAPEKYKKYLSAQGYAMLNHPMTLQAIDDVKTKKKRTFWLGEEEILSGLYNEATNLEDKSTQAARIQAWVWLGKHIGMFGDASKNKSLLTAQGNDATKNGPTYNIINYNNNKTTDQSDSNLIIEGVTEVKDQINKLEVGVEDSLDISIKSYA